MNQRSIDVVLSTIATIVAMALSWPFWRDFHYWPVSRLAWYVYFGLGFVLAWYVFYAFIRALHTLFAHDALAREGKLEPARGKGDAP